MVVPANSFFTPVVPPHPVNVIATRRESVRTPSRHRICTSQEPELKFARCRDYERIYSG